MVDYEKIVREELEGVRETQKYVLFGQKVVLASNIIVLIILLYTLWRSLQ